VSGLTAQVCGDAHLSNFGAYASPERHLVFDVNDFDETLPGPEWDLKRLATSFEIASQHRGFPSATSRSVTAASVHGYRQAMAGSPGSGTSTLVRAASCGPTGSARRHEEGEEEGGGE
jgi:uncharacterized protein (DUF2252 family)